MHFSVDIRAKGISFVFMKMGDQIVYFGYSTFPTVLDTQKSLAAICSFESLIPVGQELSWSPSLTNTSFLINGLLACISKWNQKEKLQMRDGEISKHFHACLCYLRLTFGTMWAIWFAYSSRNVSISLGFFPKNLHNSLRTSDSSFIDFNIWLLIYVDAQWVWCRQGFCFFLKIGFPCDSLLCRFISSFSLWQFSIVCSQSGDQNEILSLKN